MTHLNDPRWREQTRCAEADPEAFFPQPGTRPTTALRICAGCPVRDDISFGVLGGLTPTQRRNLLRKHNNT